MNTDGSDVKRHVIELHGVGRQYGRQPAVHALVDFDLTVDRGDWLAVTGPSGAGKSTLLNIIGCLDRPTSGSYYIDGIDTAKLTDREGAGLRGERIGFVFQAFHLLPYRTVLENVMLTGIYRKLRPDERQAQAMAAIERVGLAHRTSFPPTKLSGGEQQRVAIARALVGSPSLLLCDEPTGNLDSASSASILDLFGELNRDGLSLVVVTHDPDVADRASRRVHIVDGRRSDVADAEPVSRTPSAIATTAERPVVKSGIRMRDLADEALAGIFSRPGRMVLTITGIVIGLAALVATLGLTRTAGNRIVSRFDRLAATEIFVKARPGRISGMVDPKAIPWDAAARLERLNGVVAVGTLSEVDLGGALASSLPVKDPLEQSAFSLPVYAASAGLFRAVRAKLKAGRFPDSGHSRRNDRVAVLGPDAARRLNIGDLEPLPAIYLGDYLYLVVGILEDVVRKPELLSSVIIPEGAARTYFGLAGPGVVVVETKLGAPCIIAKQAPLALRPDNPRILKLELPREPRRVRDDVQTDVNVMFLILGGLSLIVSAIGIANITLVGVMERTAEIGLRRALGATRGHIAAQFLFESASIGVIGGIIGASAGILIVVGVSACNTWTPVLDPMAPLLAPLVGGGIGLLAGTYPAMRAANLEPAEALRH